VRASIYLFLRFNTKADIRDGIHLMNFAGAMKFNLCLSLTLGALVTNFLDAR
jgi:hypothetical protein